MAYVENFTSKLDWSMPFQRTGKFPIDRTSIFDSYEDAMLYAGQGSYSVTRDGKTITTDKRELCGTSYVGQVITVYGLPKEGTVEEVAAYVITAVGATPALMKLAQTTASGDVAQDVASLWTAIGKIQEDITALNAFKDEMATKPDVNTTYTFDTATTTDGAIKWTAMNGETVVGSSEVQIKGWQSLVNLATGRTSAFVYSGPNDSAFLTDAMNPNKFKVGDLIYYTANEVADQWVTAKLDAADSEGIWYTFSNLEVEKVDLSQYSTTTEIAQIYATKEALNSKANQSALTNLEAALTTYKAQVEQSFTDVNTAIQGLQDQLDGIDVSSQITAKINELDVSKVGGTDNSYIKAIEQVDGKIVATASSLPDFDGNAQGYAATAKSEAIDEAKDYVDEKLGNITEADVATFVETKIGAVNTNISTNVVPKIEGLETTVGGHTTWINEKETLIGQHTSKISTLETETSSLKTRVSTAENKLATVEENAERNVINEIKLGGVTLTPDANRSVNISQISTDLLVTGKEVLVLDCGTASGTSNT